MIEIPEKFRNLGACRLLCALLSPDESCAAKRGSGGGDFGFLTTPRSRSRRRAWTCTRSVFTVLRGLMMRHASIREAANDRRGTGRRRAPDDHRRRLATHPENGNSAANGSEGAPGANGNGKGAGKRELLTPPDAHDYGEEGAFSETESGGVCADGGGGDLLTLTSELVLTSDLVSDSLSSFLTVLTPGTPRAKSPARTFARALGTVPISATRALSERTLMSALFNPASLSKRAVTAPFMSSSFASTNLRCRSGTTCRRLVTPFTPSTRLAICSATFFAWALSTLPRSVTIPACVSTLIFLPFTWRSAKSFVFVFVVSHESLISVPLWPVDRLSSAVLAGVACWVLDCADATGAESSAARITPRTKRCIAVPPLSPDAWRFKGRARRDLQEAAAGRR